MRILISAGGTGGSVYPALSVVEALNEQHPDVEVVFVGSVQGFERDLVQSSHVRLAEYHEVQSGPLHGVSILRGLVSMIRLLLGFVQSLGLIWRTRPAVLFITGGWVTFPITVAAWVLRVPIMVFVPDIEPGLAIQVLQRFCQQVATATERSRPYVPQSKMVVTGYPVRRTIAQATRELALRGFDLDSTRKTLLVFGGSRGARSINLAILAVLPELLELGLQVIHISGTLDYEAVQANLPQLVAPQHYHLFPYLHEEQMGMALAAADLVVSRAGASILGEFPIFRLPAILIPYPYAWRYQKVNAEYLATQGAAVMLMDQDMSERLYPMIHDLIGDAPRLAKMAVAMQQAGYSNGSARLATQLMKLAGERQR